MPFWEIREIMIIALITMMIETVMIITLRTAVGTKLEMIIRLTFVTVMMEGTLM